MHNGTKSKGVHKGVKCLSKAFFFLVTVFILTSIYFFYRYATDRFSSSCGAFPEICRMVLFDIKKKNNTKTKNKKCRSDTDPERREEVLNFFFFWALFFPCTKTTLKEKMVQNLFYFFFVSLIHLNCCSSTRQCCN